MFYTENKVICHFLRKQAQQAYKILVKALRPTFTGSVDHRINMIELAKIQPVLNLQPES